MSKVAHSLASLPELALGAFNYAMPLLSAFDPADSFGCNQLVIAHFYLI